MARCNVEPTCNVLQIYVPGQVLIVVGVLGKDSNQDGDVSEFNKLWSLCPLLLFFRDSPPPPSRAATFE